MTNAKVLILDDSATARKIISALCRKIGVSKTVEVETAREAMERLLVDADYSLIICDLNMPGTNGLQFLSAIRSNALTRDLPFVFITSESEARHIATAKTGGANAYLTKPVLFETFKGAIEELLAGKNADSTVAAA